MVLKWLHSIIVTEPKVIPLEGRAVSPKGTSGSEKEEKLLDVAHEALANDARERQVELKGLELYGWSFFRRRRLKQKVRTKVKQFLNIPMAEEDQWDAIEEVTEKIIEAAEVDPHYISLFQDSEKER